LGNIYYLREDLTNAQVYYQKAYEERPDHPKAAIRNVSEKQRTQTSNISSLDFFLVS